MPIPEPLGLSHEPIALVPYAGFDGRYAGETDALWLSIGRATYDKTELSLKVFRHTGDKFSRQSEELPMHRVIDLAILAVLMIEQIEDGRVTVPAGTFHNQTEDLELPVRGTPVELYAARQRLADPVLAKRIDTLHRLLNRAFGHQPVRD